MNGALPTFSISMPTYNRCEIVERTIRHLLHQDYPHDRYEIIVVDNSSDRTPDMVEDLARSTDVRVQVIRSANRLPAVKRNEGLRAATGDLMLYMNDDVWVAPTFLREHAKTHAAHEGPVAVIGRCIQSDAMPATPFIRWYEPFSYSELEGRGDEALPWFYFWTMNISLPRREMVDRNLVFHEDWAEIGNEDVELGYRWVQAGNRIFYNTAASGQHYHPHDVASVTRLQAQIGRGLRDLEVLAPDPYLLERYGIFSWRNSRRAIVRGSARRALFNARTVPLAERWLTTDGRDSRLAKWLYWKVFLHHTNAGYRSTPPRRPVPVPTLPRPRQEVAA